MSPEPFNPHPMLRPDFLSTAVDWDDALALVEKMLAEEDGDKLADLMEHAVDRTERAHAVIFHMWARLRLQKTPRTLIEEGIGL